MKTIHLAVAVAVGGAVHWPTMARAEANAVAVLDIQGTDVDPKLLPTLSEILTVEVDQLGIYKVVAGRDIQAMLGFEREKDVFGCNDASCMAEIGGALGVDRILAGHIGKVGDTFVLNIKLLNLRLASTEGRIYETVVGKQDQLIATIRSSVNKLLGPGSKAAAAVKAAMAPAPAAAAAPAAAPARADAQAESASAAPAGASPMTEPQPPPADEADEPVYKKWWLWTIVGVVVAGGVAGGVAAGLASSSSSGGPDGTLEYELLVSGSLPRP